MSKQRMEQSWERVKTQIMTVWTAVDDQDLKQARGDLGQMVDLIHAKTGEDRTTIRRKLVTLV